MEPYGFIKKMTVNQRVPRSSRGAGANTVKGFRQIVFETFFHLHRICTILIRPTVNFNNNTY